MDNLEYLNKISTKSTNKPQNNNRLLSPTMIKVIVGGAAALILIIVLGIIINSTNGKTSTLYETLYLRLQNLSADNGPLATYARDLKSSDLRAVTGTLKSSLTVTTNNFSRLLPDININLKNISEDTATSEANLISEYASSLQTAKLNGYLDRTFASSTTLQISLLLALQSEILEKTSNDAVKEILSQSSSDLTLLHARFVELSNNSN
jgi:hypothetical protein